jgi:hypothetical protein
MKCLQTFQTPMEKSEAPLLESKISTTIKAVKFARRKKTAKSAKDVKKKLQPNHPSGYFIKT